MTLGEFQKIITDKEKILIAEGVFPKQLSLAIPAKLLAELNYVLTENTRFVGFYGIYKIEASDSGEEPVFVIESTQ
jgi:hypothetical protein